MCSYVHSGHIKHVFESVQKFSDFFYSTNMYYTYAYTIRFGQNRIARILLPKRRESQINSLIDQSRRWLLNRETIFPLHFTVAEFCRCIQSTFKHAAPDLELSKGKTPVDPGLRTKR
jgi:hypothetical protein